MAFFKFINVKLIIVPKFVDYLIGNIAILLKEYNGPPVKTTLSNFIVNQIFPILTLAASRATPFVQAAVSRLRQQVALTGRWWPVTLLPLRGAWLGNDFSLFVTKATFATIARP